MFIDKNKSIWAALATAVLGSLLVAGCGDDGANSVSTASGTVPVSAPVVTRELPANYAADGIPRIYEDTADTALLADGSRLFLTHADVNGQEEGFAQLFPTDGTAPKYFRVGGSEGSGKANLVLEEVSPTDELLDSYHLTGAEDDAGHLTSLQFTHGAAPVTESDQALLFSPTAMESNLSRAVQRVEDIDRATRISILPDVRQGSNSYVGIPISGSPTKTWFLPEVWRMGSVFEVNLKEMYYVWWPGQHWACCDCWEAGIQIYKGDLPFVNGRLDSRKLENPRFGKFYAGALRNPVLPGDSFALGVFWP